MTMTASKKRFGAIGILLLASVGAAMAEEQCPYQAPLLSLAETVLTERWTVPPIQVRSFGSEAAFLKIRYGSMTGGETEALLDQLVAERVRFSPDLRLAWLIGHRRPGAAVPLTEDDFAIMTSTSGISSIRAMMVSGRSNELLARFVPMSEAQKHDLTQAMTVAVIDMPDAFKAELASAAMNTGELGLAVALTATMRDRGAWKRFARTVTDKVALDASTRTWKWLPAIVGNPALPFSEEGLTAGMRANRAQFHDIIIAAALQPEAEFLNTFFNATGDIDTTRVVADRVRNAFDAYDIAPRGTLDQGWLLAFRGLSEKFGAERVRTTLDTSAGAGRHGLRTIAAVIDRLIAIDSLKPLVTGADEAAVTMPDDLSEEDRARWPQLIELAARIRTNARDPALAADTADLSIIADLIFARTDMDALAQLLADAPPSMATVATAADFAKRLDRLCNSYLWHPGEAVLLPGQPIYKFD